MSDLNEFEGKQSAEMYALRRITKAMADAGVFEAKIMLKYDQIHRHLQKCTEPFIRGAFPVKEAVAQDYFLALCDIESRLIDFECCCGMVTERGELH